jgi:hypothetical protein
MHRPSGTSDIRRRVADREAGQARVTAVTATAAVASVVTVGVVAVALPGGVQHSGPQAPVGGSPTASQGKHPASPSRTPRGEDDPGASTSAGSSGLSPAPPPATPSGGGAVQATSGAS